MRASLARVLSLAWVATAQPRYYDAGRAHLAALLRSLTFGDSRQVYADRDGYAIGSAISTADALRASGDEGDRVGARRAHGSAAFDWKVGPRAPFRP